MTVRVAPVVSVDFRDFDAGFFQRIPDLACAPVNELGSQLNRDIALWIMNREHSSTDPVACFHDAHRKTGAAQFAGRSHSSHACTNDNYVGVSRHLLSVFQKSYAASDASAGAGSSFHFDPSRPPLVECLVRLYHRGHGLDLGQNFGWIKRSRPHQFNQMRQVPPVIAIPHRQREVLLHGVADRKRIEFSIDTNDRNRTCLGHRLDGPV